MSAPAPLPFSSPGLRYDDEQWIYSHAEFQNCEQRLSQALAARSRIIVLTGASGVGKSTIARRAVDRARRAGDRAISVVSTHLEPRELLRALAYGLGVDVDGRGSCQGLGDAVLEFATRQAEAGRACFASIDEAHNLPDDSLAELLALTESRGAQASKLRVLLSGTADLPVRIAQLSGSLNPVCLDLPTVSDEDVCDFLRARLAALTWGHPPNLSQDALDRVAELSGGVARQMNLLCTRLAVHSDLESRYELGTSDVEYVVAELRDESILTFNHQLAAM